MRCAYTSVARVIVVLAAVLVNARPDPTRTATDLRQEGPQPHEYADEEDFSADYDDYDDEDEDEAADVWEQESDAICGKQREDVEEVEEQDYSAFFEEE